ncbi:bifunctional glutamate N-acetyltransferase/amino-acid acetyltransferase ArgJ [Salinibius halmophilus]|uniref:bifunctional glutamate N-acetyltransferase/amino-acid acetyltransferase ArgJ n=1 Tax=Salinibius halmophilus TaxID=1853216 RepID=UPI000E66093D|nr:bifunctional glutamate N-acetyltransferase/amino-acid acetyltransferase ArgJ [Salinibius halmophilus]
MAVGPETISQLLPVAGVEIAIAQAGVKKPGKDDVTVMRLSPATSVAGVYTANAFCAAPVVVAKAHASEANPQALLINTGNANAGTGKKGHEAAQQSCAALASALGLSPEQVLPFSTGVIGEPLPVAKITATFANLAFSADNWNRAASAIMTTDTRPKGISKQIEIDGKLVTITGISKGSGMIKPNMATMLAYIATDAEVAQPRLQQMLSQANEASFNRITVDGDTSTNDACIAMATGASGVVINDDSQAAFFAAFNEVMTYLAHAIVLDGEGATKFVAIKVSGAATTPEALDVAYTIAHSPLVKTALTASDANWGRILACVGRAGVENLDLANVNIWLDNVQIVDTGGRCDSYEEAAGSSVVAQERFTIHVSLGRGEVVETVYTTDLSHEYIRINAEYRS